MFSFGRRSMGLSITQHHITIHLCAVLVSDATSSLLIGSFGSSNIKVNLQVWMYGVKSVFDSNDCVVDIAP